MTARPFCALRRPSRRWAIPALLALLAQLAGCAIQVRLNDAPWRDQASLRAWESAPRLRQDKEDIESRLAERPARLRRQRAGLKPSIADPDRSDINELVEALRTSWSQGLTAHAATLLRERSELEASSPAKDRLLAFDDLRSAELVDLRAWYRSSGRGGALLVQVRRRPQVQGRIAVAFPPGSYARPYLPPSDEELFGDWPQPTPGNAAGVPISQDLVFLSARVAVLESGDDQLTLRIPVACGRFNKGEPKDRERFLLVRFAPNTSISQLLGELCRIQSRGLNHGAAQMAIWILRDRLTWKQWRRRMASAGPSLTFETGRVITESDAMDASELLIDAGIDPRRSRFYAVPEWSR